MTALPARVNEVGPGAAKSATVIEPPRAQPLRRHARKVKPQFAGDPNSPAAEAASPKRLGILLLVGLMSLVLFAAAAARHYLFRSGAMDLAFFDQLVWLISRGKPPVSSINGLHLLGDHAAWILYAVAPLYWIFANPYSLLALQALALAGAAYPLWRIALLSECSPGQALALALAYLLYPIVLATDVFDFHPETLAVPALMCAALCAKRGQMATFVLSLIVALGTKEIVGLTVIAMGVWLLIDQRDRPAFGILAIMLGVASFLFATRWIIPHFGAGKEASGVRLFTYLGPSVSKIVVALFTQPGRWVPQVLRPEVLIYLGVIFVPVCWGLSFRGLLPLLVAVPTMVLNMLADTSTGEDLLAPLGHYSLLAVPFIALALVEGVSSGGCLIKRPRYIAAWSVVLLVLGAAARLMMVKPEQLRDGVPTDHNANRVAMLRAIDRLPRDAAVLTTFEIAPHVSERPFVQFLGRMYPNAPVDHFDAVLLNESHDSVRNEPARMEQLRTAMKSGRFGTFQTVSRDNGVVLYRRVHEPTSARAE